jgi:hypothetical protein
LPGFDEAVRRREPVHKAAADRLHVESGAALDAELRLQQARGARKHVVGGRGRHDDQVDLAGFHAGGIERAFACFEREVARALALLGDVALDDAGALADPRVAGIEARGEFRVGHDPRRQIAAGARDARVDHSTGWTGWTS